MSESKNVSNAVSNYLNNYSRDKEKLFIEQMNTEHRTLQQSFTKLCLMWLENCANDEYPHDLRNKDSHDISKKIVDSFKNQNENFLPSQYISHV